MSIRCGSWMSIGCACLMRAGHVFSNECQIELSPVQQVWFSMSIRYSSVMSIRYACRKCVFRWMSDKFGSCAANMDFNEYHIWLFQFQTISYTAAWLPIYDSLTRIRYDWPWSVTYSCLKNIIYNNPMTVRLFNEYSIWSSLMIKEISQCLHT